MVSGVLVARLGYDLLVTSVFIIYSVRLFGFSLVTEPRHVFLCEILKPFGNNLAMVLAAHFLTANSNGDNVATLEVSDIKLGKLLFNRAFHSITLKFNIYVNII